MKKIINGYIARDGNDLIFSDQPMKQDGYIDEGDILWPTLTDEELARMKHALGFDNKDAEDGVFEAYRRCSFYNEVHETWEGLVAKGYAKHSPCGVGCYAVTESGMQAVANATGLIIRFELEFEPKK